MAKSVFAKTIILESAMLASAAIFGFLFRNFITAPVFSSLILVAAAGVVFLTGFLLQAMLVSDFRFAAAGSAFSILIMGLFLIDRASPVLIIGAILAFGLLVSAHRASQSEIKNNLKIRFWKIARTVSAAGTMAIAIFTSLAYFSLFNPQDINSSKNALGVIINPLEPVIAGYLPGFTAQSSLAEIARESLPAEFRLASEEVKNQAINQVAGNLAKLFSQLSGVSVSAGDSLLDVLYRASFGRLAGLSAFLQNLILAAIALVFFFLIKFSLFIVNWPAILLGFLIYNFLLSSGFFRLELRNLEKEAIILGDE